VDSIHSQNYRSRLAASTLIAVLVIIVSDPKSATAQSERQSRPNPVSVQGPQHNRGMDQPAAGRMDDAAKVVDAAVQAHAAEVLPNVDPATVGTSLRVLVAVTILGLVPSILMMTTCFVRFSIVLGLLRQALGTSQALPGQISTALAMFLTFLVMSPVWQRAYDDGIHPYTNPAPGIQPLDEATAFQKTVSPLRDFMARQIDQAGNADAVWMLIDYQRPETKSQAASDWNEPKSYDDVGLNVLAPAYLLSELKVAFLIGFQIFLPFLVIDLVVASILTSLGLNMLPPSMVSLPFKLLLFVLIDGWFLTVGMLLESVRLA
jgi:flagellar biosynthetic protein FliP